MVQLVITETCKGYSPKDTYRVAEQGHKNFADIVQANMYLKEQYGNCKKQKMFIDTKDGKTLVCGYIFSFKNADTSHFPVEKWLQRDWVSFQEVKTMNLADSIPCIMNLTTEV